MNPLRMFGKAVTASQGTFSLACKAGELEGSLQALRFNSVLVSGFISPHLDIDQVARQLKQRFPTCAISLCTTSGELSNVTSSCTAPLASTGIG
jgi:hypothetical protein